MPKAVGHSGKIHLATHCTPAPTTAQIPTSVLFYLRPPCSSAAREPSAVEPKSGFCCPLAMERCGDVAMGWRGTRRRDGHRTHIWEPLLY